MAKDVKTEFWNVTRFQKSINQHSNWLVKTVEVLKLSPHWEKKTK